ncbi:MAG: D-2-hydroxyacid dehydrogenase [Dehalococcoidia bacterium]
MGRVNVLLTLGLTDRLVRRVRAVDPRLAVKLLSPAQRRIYRGGRSIWYGYAEDEEEVGAGKEASGAAVRDLEAALARTEVLLTSPTIHPDIVTLAPGLRWVQLTSAGVDHLLESDLVKKGVVLTTASGVHAITMGEFVLGLILSFAKGLHGAVRQQRERSWRPYLADELYGKTVGIIGLGAIGGQIARLAKALGMRVLATRRSTGGRRQGAGDVDELLPPSSLSYLLAESDYVVIAAPLTAETRHMVGEMELRAMKRSAVIINVSRGAIVDEAALVRALKEGRVAGAALDVFEVEPLPPQSELWAMDNVVITPHVAGGTPLYMERAVDLFCDNLRRYLSGEPLRNLVDVARGY